MSLSTRGAAQHTTSTVMVWGAYGVGNLGNNATAMTLVSWLRERFPDIQVLMTTDAPDFARHAGAAAVPRRWRRPSNAVFLALNRVLRGAPGFIGDFLHAFRAMKNVDLMLVGGTGVLDDFGGVTPRGAPLLLLQWSVAARLRAARCAWIAIGAGPLSSPLSQRLARMSAAISVHRSYRDTASVRFLDSIGVDTTHDFLVPDLVFLLPSPVPNADRHPPRVSIAVMRYLGWTPDAYSMNRLGTYTSILARMGRDLLSAGFEVEILSADEDDDEAAEAVASKMEAPGINVKQVRSLVELVDVLGYADVVVATRFHAVLSALLASAPVISLGYGTKNELLMERMQLGAFCQHIDNINYELLQAQARKCIVRNAELRQLIERGVELRRRELEDYLDNLPGRLGAMDCSTSGRTRRRGGHLRRTSYRRSAAEVADGGTA